MIHPFIDYGNASTPTIMATALSLLLVMMLAGCQSQNSSNERCVAESREIEEQTVGGGSIDMATGRVTVGGCVETEAIK
jgi:hypothetical protein